MAVDPKTVMTYLKVQAKAQAVTGAEKETAEKILRKMEADHPGVERLAAAFKAAQESVSSAKPEYSEHRHEPRYAYDPDEPEIVYAEEIEEPSGNWENIFRWAGKAVSGVYGFAENIAQASVGRDLAAHIKSATRKTNAGSVIISFKMPIAAYRYALRLNALQKSAFRQAVHELLDNELDNFLGEED